MALKDPAELLVNCAHLLRPAPKLTRSEWADRYFYVLKGGSIGRWKTRPYQKEILDNFGNRQVWRQSVMKSARIGWTTMLNIDECFCLHWDPCDSTTMQPTIGDAEKYSRDTFNKIIENVPAISELFASGKFRDGSNSILEKYVKGGSLSFIGGNSPNGLRRTTYKVARADETDGYPVMGAGNDGDQIQLLINRTIDYWDRTFADGSTPTIEDFSRIEKSFKQGDQRRRFLPCPHCGHMQYLVWRNTNKPGGFWWEPNKPETAVYICEECEKPIEHREKRWMDENGIWKPMAPANVAPDGREHRSYHIWAAYSYQANATWAHLIHEYEKTKEDPLQYQTFVNTWRGEAWKDDAGSRITTEGLLGRRDAYKSGEIPEGVLCLTAGVDCQDDRLEISIWGWGRGSKSESAGPEPEGWLILHERIHERYNSSAAWSQLDEYLHDDYKRADGVTLKIMGMAVDSGDGDHSSYVYDYANSRKAEHVIATKGVGTAGKPAIGRGTRVEFSTKGKALKKSAMMYIVGTDGIKTRIMGRLRYSTTPGPGCLHFPADVDQEYFDQLVSERQSLYYQHGTPKRRWVRKAGARAETLDCAVYAYASLHHVFMRYNRKTFFDQMEATIGTQLTTGEVIQDKQSVRRSFNVLGQ